MKSIIVSLLISLSFAFFSCSKDDDNVPVWGSYVADGSAFSVNEANYFSYEGLYYIMLYAYPESDTCATQFVLSSIEAGSYTQAGNYMIYTDKNSVKYSASRGKQSQFTLVILRHNGDTVVGTYSANLANLNTINTADSSYLSVTNGTFKALITDELGKK
jgi:hypothetical protein